MWHMKQLRDSRTTDVDENKHLLLLESEALSMHANQIRSVWCKAWTQHPCTLAMLPLEHQGSMFLSCVLDTNTDAQESERQKWSARIEYQTNKGRIQPDVSFDKSLHDRFSTLKQVESSMTEQVLRGRPVWHVWTEVPTIPRVDILKTYMETKGCYLFQPHQGSSRSVFRYVHEPSCAIRSKWILGPETNDVDGSESISIPATPSSCQEHVVDFLQTHPRRDERVRYTERLIEDFIRSEPFVTQKQTLVAYHQMDRVRIDETHFSQDLLLGFVSDCLEPPEGSTDKETHPNSLQKISQRIAQHMRVEIYLTYDPDQVVPEKPLIPCLLAAARAEASGLYVHTFVYMSRRYVKANGSCLIDGPRLVTLISDAVRLVFLKSLGMYKPIAGLNIRNPVLRGLWDSKSPSTLQKAVLTLVRDILFPKHSTLTRTIP